MNRTYLLLAGLFAVVLIVVFNVPTGHGTNVPTEAPPAAQGAAGEPVPAR
jgi:hypothetical protein